MKALQLTAYGDPKNVIKLVEQPEYGALAADEWIIDMEAAPVSPTDQYIIAGIYGELPPLPHGLGCEGVGRVSAVGSSVTHVKVGDRVIAPMLQNTTWSTRIKTKETWQRALPEGDLCQMAQVGMNPITAFLILTEFKTLKAGDWVISTAANSAVGRSVIPIAKSRGMKTVNIVRSPDLIDEMKRIGGDVVLTDGPDLVKQIKEATGGANIQLALDGVGGALTQQLVDAVGLYGTVVLWSRMGGVDPTIATIPVLFTGKSLHGFWIVNWLKVPGNRERLTAAFEEIAPLVASGKVVIPVAGEFELDQYVDAIALASKYNGKAILYPNGRR
ncbi:zinc-dependent alcohol dehydrogenase family protein [Paraburkholderia nemoris]|uniref:zinc-dependent alcohol dehydrogenase family protein n=1 Tax=Paraburkholderia nemoris TaxID=2793076 RepID=UPI001B219EA9|nr:zinc-dependent alcohol dehydrogenase family protein [Paraburkholderia nemoris]CAE6837557.1 Quinone oxidoreductase 1 [Paraburkholderia nemoris]